VRTLAFHVAFGHRLRWIVVAVWHTEHWPSGKRPPTPAVSHLSELTGDGRGEQDQSAT
jgi:hypothetical protein